MKERERERNRSGQRYLHLIYYLSIYSLNFLLISFQEHLVLRTIYPICVLVLSQILSIVVDYCQYT